MYCRGSSDENDQDRDQNRGAFGETVGCDQDRDRKWRRNEVVAGPDQGVYKSSYDQAYGIVVMSCLRAAIFTLSKRKTADRLWYVNIDDCRKGYQARLNWSTA